MNIVRLEYILAAYIKGPTHSLWLCKHMTIIAHLLNNKQIFHHALKERL